jgi:two-component system, NtrC family, sensor kinase
MANLVILGGTKKGEIVAIDTDNICIGRGDQNDVIIPEPRVSGSHAEIFSSDGNFFIRDLGSTNGTFVNTNPVTETQLHEGDRIELGDIALLFQIDIPGEKALEEFNKDSLINMVFHKDENCGTTLEFSLDVPAVEIVSRDISRISSQEQLSHLNTRLASLYSILQKVNIIDSVDRLLELTLKELFRELGVDRAVLMLVNPASGKLEPKAAKNRKETPGPETIHVSQTIIDNVVERGEAVLIRDAQQDNRFEEAQSIINIGTRSAMCVPLKTENKMLGILYADKLSHTEIYNEDDLKFLAAICNQVAVSINNAQLFAEVRSAEEEIKRSNEKLKETNKAVEDANSLLEESYKDLQRTQEQLIQSEKLSSLGQVVAGLSHDMKNPLAAIYGYSELLETWITDEKHLNAIKKLRQATTMCTSIVQDLMSFAREEKIQRQETDINDLVAKSVELLQAQVGSSGINVHMNLGRDIPDVQIDSNQVMRVFNNIIGNAIQAMDGEGELNVNTNFQEQCIQVEINDTGPGIPDENLSKIFDPFFTTKERGKGTGLGLSTCFGVIKAHGGTITPGNLTGAGASFKIRLPIEQNMKIIGGHTQQKEDENGIDQS